MAFSYLATFIDDFENMNLEVVRRRTHREKEMVLKLIKSRFNSPLTSSVGRLFDAVSALLGVCERSTYEGQAAMELEMALEGSSEDCYPFSYVHNECVVVDPAPLIREILSDLKGHVPVGTISLRFHNSMVAMIADVCGKLRERFKINRVALSGGCFQNTYLLSRSIEQLEKVGFEIFYHKKVPPNDGGISLGQALVANECLIRK